MLTKFQDRKYWREWSAARRAIETMRGRRLTPAEADEQRYICHSNASVPKSHLDLTNKTFDLVLAAFWSWSYASSMTHQGRQIDQPVTRCRYVAEKFAADLMAVRIQQGRGEDAAKLSEGAPRDGYIRAMLRRASGEDKLYAQDYGEKIWIKVIHMLSIALRREEPRNPEADVGWESPRAQAKAPKPTLAAVTDDNEPY